MTRAKRAIHRKHRGLWLTLGATAVVIAAAVVASTQLASDHSPSGLPAPTSTGPSTPTVGSPPAQKQSTAGSDAKACADEIRTTEAVVAAARTATEHWREHVQARTDLLSGKNTEADTKAIWKRTRLAGPGDIAALNSAVAAQTDSAGSCAKLPTASCKERLAALDLAAAADRTSAADWARHLGAMAAHAAGDFGAEHAQELWVAAWSGASTNLNRAARANAALSKAPACHPA